MQADKKGASHEVNGEHPVATYNKRVSLEKEDVYTNETDMKWSRFYEDPNTIYSRSNKSVF